MCANHGLAAPKDVGKTFAHVSVEQPANIGGGIGGRNGAWTGTQELDFGLDIYRIAKKTAQVFFEPYWGDEDHPAEPAIVEVLYKEALQKPIRVMIHDGIRYRVLGFLGGTRPARFRSGLTDTEDAQPWRTAVFLAPASWIGSYDLNQRRRSRRSTDPEPEPKIRGAVQFALDEDQKLPLSAVTLRATTPAGSRRARAWSRKSLALYEAACLLPFEKTTYGKRGKMAAPPAWAERANMTVYRRPYEEWVFPYSTPTTRKEMTTDLRVCLAPGEREPLTFTIYAHRRFKRLEIEVSELEGSRGRFPGTVEVASVDCRWLHHRRRNEATGEEIKVCGLGPRRILPYHPEDGLTLGARESRRIWLTVAAPPGTRPGIYTGPVKLRGDGVSLPLKATVEVLPFRLPESPVKHGFHIGAVPTDAELRHIRSLGMQTVAVSAALGSLGLHTFVEDKKIACDFEGIDRNMDRFRKAGLSGPIYIQMFRGGGELTHREWRRLRAKGLVRHMGEAVHNLIGKGQIVTREYFDRFAQEFGIIPRHVKAAGWPETVFVAATGLSDVGAPVTRDYAEAVHRLMPDVRMYASSTGRWRKNGFYWRGRYGRYLRDYLTSWGTRAYDFDGRMALDSARLAEAKRAGKCVIEFPTHNGIRTGLARFTYGFYAWAMSADGVLIGHYKRFSSTGYTDIDGGWENSAMVLGEENDLVPIPAAEGIREGIDDIRYIAALEQVAKQKGRQAEADRLLNKIRQEVVALLPDAAGAKRPMPDTNVPGPWGNRTFRELQQWRERIVRAIRDMSG